MANQTKLIQKIRRLEARIKVLHHLLEEETGVTELQGLMLTQLNEMPWTNHIELRKLGWSWDKNSKAVTGLKNKGYVDYESKIAKPIRFRINAAGRQALERFKEHQ